MSTDKNYGTIADHQGDTFLTVAYGDETAGWTTNGIDVSMFDVVQFEATYHHYSTAALLSMRFLAGDRNAADLDDYVDMYEDPDSNNTLSVLEKTLDVSAMVNDTDNKFVMPPLDVRGISMLRVAAKIDVATNDPELTLRYLGVRSVGRPELTTPAVS